jgi:hypothetical protein
MAEIPFYNIDRNDTVNLTSLKIYKDPANVTVAGTTIENSGGTSALGGQTLSGLWILNYDYNYILTITTAGANNDVVSKFLVYSDYTESGLTEAQA